MVDPHKRTPVTIEDLLRLKKAERPAPEFWARFEVELRQKQLAALVQRRPWWQQVPALLVRPKALLPIGALAALALTVVSLKVYSPVTVALSHPEVQAVRSAPLPTAPTETVAAVAVPTPATKSASAAAIENPAEASVALSPSLPERATELSPWSPSASRQDSSLMLTARLAKRDAPQAVSGAASVSEFYAVPAMARAEPAAVKAELASVSAATSKRSRLLAQFGERHFVPEPQAPQFVRDRLARQLADTEFNDAISRVGLKGDQVSLRF